MEPREKLLRKILESVGAARYLNADQTQELLDHLNDSISVKTAAGTHEHEAIAAALDEMGDLRRVARSIRRQNRREAVTAEGTMVTLVERWAFPCLNMLFAVLFVPLATAPTFAFFAELHVQGPPLSHLTLSFGLLLLRNPILILLGLLLMAGLIWRWPRSRFAVLAVQGGAFLLLALWAVGALLPLVSLLQGISGRS